MKIFYKVNNKKTGRIMAIYDNKEQARTHASQNKNLFVAVGWDYQTHKRPKAKAQGERKGTRANLAPAPALFVLFISKKHQTQKGG